MDPIGFLIFSVKITSPPISGEERICGSGAGFNGAQNLQQLSQINQFCESLHKCVHIYDMVAFLNISGN